MDEVRYEIRRAHIAPALNGDWDCEPWPGAETARIQHYYDRSSTHRPDTEVRVMHHAKDIHVIFRVQDRYVRCINTEYMSNVYQDACVEFFVEPRPDKGYFNFEMNCGGTLLISYVEDPTRTPTGFTKFTRVPWDLAEQIAVFHSLPKQVEPEIESPIEWRVQYVLPVAILEHYVGSVGEMPGQTWRGNFYKCAENNSHPHWGSWARVGGELNFHQPRYFAPMYFGE